ncbi:MAG TPA: TonB-dependent receptor [Verrucomicrobiae bacterium]|nr:TonB-dependent receptor [Verrucomicrobiae bacterium]
MHRIRLGLFVFVLAFAFVLCGKLFAGVTASISGTVKDASGAVVPGAAVVATNVDTGIATTLHTNGDGYYSFPTLAVGNYTIDVTQTGFKAYHQSGLVLQVNQALVIDVSLEVGASAEKVEVSSSTLHVDTASTQMGEVIGGKEMTDVPLVTRSYTDLLGLQPGVAQQPSAMTGAYAGPFISAGFAAPLVSGDEDSGAVSVNGMREASNGFILNGILVQETGFSGAGAIPNLDSIAEFKILTNNYDAEYGNYAGGQINVVTKSGTNQFHGNVFEFLRNTDFDAANYFAQGQRGAYHQNQFGGTFGGPIVRDKVFFFADYQGNRVVQGVTDVINGAPSTALESGDLSSVANSLVGTVSGPAFASQLSSQLGEAVTSGEPYYTPTCTNYSQCVFPNAQLPTTAFNPISANLLKYILPANQPNGQYLNSSESTNLTDNKFSGRVDGNTSLGLLTAYYYFDKFNRIDPYWPGNAPLYPGFEVDGKGQTNMVNLGATKSGATSVNEFRLGYFRLNTLFNQPQGGKGVTLASLGFASGANQAPGILPLVPNLEGVPEIDFNDFVIGVPSRPNGLIENVYQALDNYSLIVGTHTIKFGGSFHYDQLEEDLLDNVSNGNFFFGSNFNGLASETGDDFVDFLIGAPSQFVQGQSYPSYGHNFYFGLFGQDSWRVKSNLTLNYGLRYDVSSPWAVKYGQFQTIIPGEQSLVFPGSPTGWVFPGDPGVPSTLAPTKWNNFAPRLGLAYSFGDHEGMLGTILGKPGTTSIRAGWGLFYTTFEGATDFNEIGDAPFGNYTGQSQPTFASPFIPRASGNCGANPCTNLFPVPPPPRSFSQTNPASGPPYDTLAEFYNAFGTIGSSPAFYNKNKLPYAESYELSIQRQLTNSDLLTVSYVGSQGHRLLSSMSANPGNPALCLQLAAEGAVVAGTTSTTCGPGGENNIYILPNNSYVLSTRTPLSGVALPASSGANGTVLPDGNIGIIPFGNDSYFITAGLSNYNSLQVDYRHTSGRLQTLIGYTYSRAFDNSSGYGEQINPVNPRLSYGLSAFDSTHNFVASYAYTLPFDKLGGPKRLTNGWQISGITHFATGLPVTMVETDDQSLLGTGFGGPITLPVDTPNYVGPLGITNPRNTGGRFFNPAAFTQATLGQEGDSPRRFFHGPGLNNWDMALLKNTQLSEHFNLQFRAEFYNIFNHTQFLSPSGITGFSGGAPTSSSFGYVAGAASPRIGQLSLKLNF